MTTEMTATVENGLLRPDATLPFPDQTRVKLIIQLVESENQAWVAWKAFLAKIDEHPIFGDRKLFSRDAIPKTCNTARTTTA